MESVKVLGSDYSGTFATASQETLDARVSSTR